MGEAVGARGASGGGPSGCALLDTGFSGVPVVRVTCVCVYQIFVRSFVRGAHSGRAFPYLDPRVERARTRKAALGTGMGSLASLEEIAEAALRRREAQHARLSARHDQGLSSPELYGLSSPLMGSSAPPERASSFWGLAALGEGLEALPARLGEGLEGLERRVGEGLEGLPERAVERLEGLLHESPLLAATIGKSPSLHSLRSCLTPSGSLTPHHAHHHGHHGGGSGGGGGRARGPVSVSQRSSPQRAHRGPGVRIRRSLSLPTSSGMRREARRAKGTAEQLQTKALQVASKHEPLSEAI